MSRPCKIVLFLCVLAACPAQAQTAFTLQEKVAAALEADALAYEASVTAKEADILAHIAWAAVGKSEDRDYTGDSEYISIMRTMASMSRTAAMAVREGGDVLDLASSARERVSHYRTQVSLTRALASGHEGSMMRAQANAEIGGAYAALWDRAAKAQGAARTACLAEAEANESAAEAWEAVGSAAERIARRMELREAE